MTTTAATHTCAHCAYHGHQAQYATVYALGVHMEGHD